MSEDVSPSLEESTYLAGQTINYKNKSDEVKKAEILRAYKMQCTSVGVGINGILQRAVTENIPLILEGIHLLPGRVRDFKKYPSYKGRILECLITIENSENHKSRFLKRQEEAPDRKLGKYLDNFQEIRWIHNYIQERAKRFNDIKIIDNSKDLEKGLEEMRKFIYS